VFLGNDSPKVTYDSYLGQFIEFGVLGDTNPSALGSSTIAAATSLGSENWSQQGLLSSNILQWYNAAIDPANVNVSSVGQSFSVYTGASAPAPTANSYPFSFGSGST